MISSVCCIQIALIERAELRLLRSTTTGDKESDSSQLSHTNNTPFDWIKSVFFGSFVIVPYAILTAYNQENFPFFIKFGRKTLNFFMYSILHFSNVFNDHLNIGNLNGYNPERPEEKKFRQWPFLLVSL